MPATASPDQITELYSTLLQIMQESGRFFLVSDHHLSRIELTDKLLDPAFLEYGFMVEKNAESGRGNADIFTNLENSGFTVIQHTKERIIILEDADTTCPATTLITQKNTVDDINEGNNIDFLIERDMVTISIENDVGKVKDAIHDLKKQYSELLEIDSAKTEPEIDLVKTASSVYTFTAIGGIFGASTTPAIVLGIDGVSPDVLVAVACASIVGCAFIGFMVGLVVRSNATSAEKTELLLGSNIKENVNKIPHNTRPRSASVDFFLAPKKNAGRTKENITTRPRSASAPTITLKGACP